MPRKPAASIRRTMLAATGAVLSALLLTTLNPGGALADNTPTPAPSASETIPEAPAVSEPAPTLPPTGETPAPPFIPPVTTGDGVDIVVDTPPVKPNPLDQQGGAPTPDTPDELPDSDAEITPPTYSDDYLSRWEAMQAAQNSLRAAKAAQTEAKAKVDAAQAVVDAAVRDYATAQNRYLAALGTEQQASEEFDQTVWNMYVSGAGDMGQIVTVISSTPEDALQNLESGYYINAAATSNLNTYEESKSATAKALADRDAAQAALDIAKANHATAVTEYEEASDAVDEAQLAFEAAQDDYGSVVNVTAPQTQIGPDGCPIAAPVGTLRDGSELIGVEQLCRKAVKQAATPQAAAAIKWAFTRLGAPYACKGVGRMDPFRFDCSSLVSRAYWDGAGIPIAGDTWAPSTRNMTPWDGVPLDPHLFEVDPASIAPGDLVLYNTCPQGGCGYRHVVMYLGSPDGGKTYWMLHTNSCGDVAKVEQFWGFGPGTNFEVVRRVMTLKGEKVKPAAFITVDGSLSAVEEIKTKKPARQD